MAQRSFWSTLPGVLTGTAALITALVGLHAQCRLLADERGGRSFQGTCTDQTGTGSLRLRR
jgi:hypothetical protein